MDIYDILKAHNVTDHCIADAIGSLLTGDIAKAEHALKRYRELNGTVCDVEPVDRLEKLKAEYEARIARGDTMEDLF